MPNGMPMASHVTVVTPAESTQTSPAIGVARFQGRDEGRRQSALHRIGVDDHRQYRREVLYLYQREDSQAEHYKARI